MASAAPKSFVEQVRRAPLRGMALAVVVLAVWIAGALYCSGYERLSSGFDNWPGSLWWSAVAVLPWLALFEWSKSGAGRRILRRPGRLALLLVGTAAVSLLLEIAVNAIAGDPQTPLALAVMRRLPAIGVSLVLILWARGTEGSAQANDPGLEAMAESIDWIEAADNYVELRLGQRTAIRRMTMRSAERTLKRKGFVRIHRRYLVNRDRIAEITGDKLVRMRCGVELPVGRRYAANLHA